LNRLRFLRICNKRRCNNAELGERRAGNLEGQKRKSQIEDIFDSSFTAATLISALQYLAAGHRALEEECTLITPSIVLVSARSSSPLRCFSPGRQAPRQMRPSSIKPTR